MKAATSYHQTNAVSQTQLVDYETKARRQEDLIISILRRHPAKVQNAEDLMLHFGNNVPITSVRRALTNLANEGTIEKCGQGVGAYGRPINLYRLVKQ